MSFPLLLMRFTIIQGRRSHFESGVGRGKSIVSEEAPLVVADGPERFAKDGASKKKNEMRDSGKNQISLHLSEKHRRIADSLVN